MWYRFGTIERLVQHDGGERRREKYVKAEDWPGLKESLSEEGWVFAGYHGYSTVILEWGVIYASKRYG